MANSAWLQIQFCLPVTGLFGLRDALFENIHAWSTEAQLLENHYNRLITSMAVLGMVVPASPYSAIAFTVHYTIA